jgi:hypothetical protein
MAYLGLALFAEGPTDHRFLAPLLTRLVADIYFEFGRGSLDVGDVLALASDPQQRLLPRDQQIAETALQNAGAFHVLCVHADGSGNAVRARQQQVTPGLTRALAALGPGYEGVGLVPVREMEAWTMVDGDALRTAFRTTLDDKTLGVVQRPRDCEKIPDPKAALDRAYALTLPGSKRGTSTPAAGVLQLIAESVRLDVLAQVPAFQALRIELKTALQTLRFIP